jgi:hypothetical protein
LIGGERGMTHWGSTTAWVRRRSSEGKRHGRGTGAETEERDGDDALQATFINGAQLDEYILTKRNSTNYWYMESPIMGNVAALVSFSRTRPEGGATCQSPSAGCH